MLFSLLCSSCVLALTLAQDIHFNQNPGSNECTTPTGQEGQCILLQKCQHLLALLRQNPRPVGAIDYLRRAQCGVEGRYPLVCCSQKGYGGSSRTPWVTTTTTEPPPPPPPPTKPSSGDTSSALLASHPNAKLLPLQECGVDYSTRIFGGEVTNLDEYPWLTLLRYRSPTGRMAFLCGGVLISHRYVLTASHCINGDLRGNTLVSVRLGEYDTNSESDCVEEVTGDTTCADQPVDVDINLQLPHPSYSRFSANQFDDIGLLRLDRDVPYTDYIKPICLPITEDLIRSLRVGDNLTVAGWGRTENSSFSPIKLKVALPLIDNKDCAMVYMRNNRQLQDAQMCAGGAQGRDSCTGDSGGPLMGSAELNGDQVHYVTGVVSFGPRDCGMAGWPGVYTRVSSYMSWILDELRP